MIKTTLAALCVGLLSAASALAAVSPEEAARLGKDLTPMGAEMAGNADGSIPPWNPEGTPIPEGFVPGSDNYINPYADETPIYTIDGSNWQEYKDFLTPELRGGDEAYLKDLSGRRLFLELKLILMEQEPVRAIERMHELKILQTISPEIHLTDGLLDLLHEIKGVLSWFNLLYLDEPYDPWKVYWYGLTSSLNFATLQHFGERLQMVDIESQRMIAQRQHVNAVLDRLYRINGNDHYDLYTLLSQYDTEILLYILARANNERIKKWISHYFTKLKGTKTLLKGRDLKNMGFKPGPVYKDILDSLLEARLNNAISTKRDEIRYVKDRFGDRLSPL